MKRTIKRDITIKTGVAILLILFIIFSFLIYDFRTVQINQAQQQMSKIINDIAFKINSQNQHLISLLKMMVNYQQLSGFAKRRESIDYLFNLVEDNPQVLGAAYCYEPNADGKDNKHLNNSAKGINDQGRFVPYVVRKNTMHQEIIILTQVFDLDSQFYQQPKKSEEITITDPFQYQDTMMVTYSAPLIINDQFVGIAAIDRSLQQIQNYLHNLNSFATAEFYLINSNNKLIASSKQSELLSKNINNLEVDFDFKHGQSLHKAKDKFWVSATVETGDWQIVMSIDKAEALSRVNQLTKNMIGLGVLAVIFLSVFLYYLIHKSLTPIFKATLFAQNLAAENFSIPNLEIKSKNEIGQLATALNKMKDKLHTKIIKLNKINEDLVKEKNKLQKYLNIAEVIFIVLDKEQKVKLINEKGANILGLSKEEIIGRNLINDFIAEEEKDKVRSKAKKLFTGQEELVTNFETTIITEQGDERIVIWNCTVLKNQQGEIEEVLNSGMDITEQRALQEELEYSKLKTEFFANLSHEFKTPLNLIFSALQMLEFIEKKQTAGAEYQSLEKYTSLIKQNSYRLLRLVNNLVDITRINADSFTMNFHNYDIVQLIKNIVLSVEDYVENKKRNLYFNSHLETEIIACDFFSLERIMLNLISNAVKFTDEDDDIIVGLFKENDEVIITVADTGVGIPNSQQEAIFKQFRQVNKSFTRNHEGSGIGLSLVKSLVDLHEGTVEVESTVEEGSKFIIKLPNRQLDETVVKDNQPEDLVEKIELEFADIDKE